MLETAPTPIIFDRTVLTALALVRAFEIIPKLYPRRAFTCRATHEAVRQRIARRTGESPTKHSEVSTIEQALEKRWLQFVSNEVNPSEPITELRLAHEYSKKFGFKLAEPMAIAQARHWIFASDHPRIRNFALAKKIRLTGTLGILVKAFKTNILSLSEVISIHTHLVNQGYRSPYRLTEEFKSFLGANNSD